MRYLIPQYINEMVYEGGQLQFVQTEEGRVVHNIPGQGPGPVEWEYQYHLKDHLGNVRLSFTTEPATIIYPATMEDANVNKEQADFENYLEVTRQPGSLYNNTDNDVNANYSVRLSGSDGEIIGLAKSLAVKPGDKVKMEVYAKYFSPSGTNTNVAAGLAGAILSAYNLTPGGGLESQMAYDAINELFLAGTVFPADDASAPKAYLNYLLFDKDFNLLQLDMDQIDISANEDGSDIPHDLMALEVEINQPGYIYIYISNENEQVVDVYFDDLKVTHELSPVIQVDDFYPFGLAYNSYQRVSTKENRFIELSI